MWHKAPEQDHDISAALTNLALDLERQLPGLAMVQVVDDVAALTGFLPRLTQLLETNRVLIVLDNLESLLTEQGEWRDARWGLAIKALTGHDGLSRVLLTSRRRPATLNNRVRVEAVHALSLQEAMLVARELPNLRALIADTDGRTLLARTLAVVQGHPKLIELADGQARDRAVLAARLDQADRAWQASSTRLQTFFDQDETTAAEDDYVRVLSDWTRAAAGGLPQPATVLFQFLCALEEDDRRGGIVAQTWGELWARLEHPGQASDLHTALTPLVDYGLVAVESSHDQDPQREVYHLHPGVAEAGRAAANPQFQAAVDAELAAYWLTGFRRGLAQETQQQGWLVLQSGRRAAPYLLRLAQWDTAAWVLEAVLTRDRSPGTVAAVLPLLRHIVEATKNREQELEHAGRLARALRYVRPAEAEISMRELLTKAVAHKRFHVARAVAGDLVGLLRATGRLDEALAITEQKRTYTRRAGLGPWTQLADEGQRLQILRRQGHNQEVLSAVHKLQETMAALPEQPEANESVEPWSVREVVLSAGVRAAVGLERWEEALTLNAKQLKSARQRNAPPLELATIEFTDYSPLLRLGRVNDAKQLLLACRAVFEREQAIGPLGRAVGALADVEDTLGHREAAVRLAQYALRYTYTAADPETIVGSHHNLANSLSRAGGEPTLALAHRLAAAIISYQTGTGQLASTLDRLALDLANLDPAVPVPASFAEVCDLVGRVEGVRLAALLDRLPRRAADGDAALAEVLRLAHQRPTNPIRRHLDA